MPAPQVCVRSHPAGKPHASPRGSPAIPARSPHGPHHVLASCTSGYCFRENRFLRLLAKDASIGPDPAFSYDNLAMQVGRRDGMSSGLEQRRWSPKSQFALETDAFAQAIRDNAVPLGVAPKEG
jgi:hypothetical protein